MWEAFNYCEVFAGRFSAEECERVIAAHQQQSALQSRMPGRDSGLIRDSDLFWVPRTTETEWIFARIWDVATQYNSAYGFELFEQMGQLQLTRYAKDQLYNWHMDLGAGDMSLRKISTALVTTCPRCVCGGNFLAFTPTSRSTVVLTRFPAVRYAIE